MHSGTLQIQELTGVLYISREARVVGTDENGSSAPSPANHEFHMFGYRTPNCSTSTSPSPTHDSASLPVHMT
jgi:hypothetical protein